MANDKFDEICGSAFDFLKRSAGEIEKSPKHALVSFAAGMELILKARLLKEHWSLIVNGRPDRVAFHNGDFLSVTPKEALERLGSAVGKPVPKDTAATFELVSAHRNKVIHFVHHLSGDKFREQVAADMCRGWVHLDALLETWGMEFAAFEKDRRQITTAMRKAKGFLGAVFESKKAHLAMATKRGQNVACCPACSFVAAPISEVADPIWKQKCLVCDMEVDRVHFTCACLHPYHFDAWNHFRPIQCQCGDTITQDDLRKEMDERGDVDQSTINCGECLAANTVIWRNGFHICLECAAHAEIIEICGWCQEGQLGGSSLEASAFAGCEHCDGRGLDDD